MQDSAMSSSDTSALPTNALRTATQQLENGSLQPSEVPSLLKSALEYASATFESATTVESARSLAQDLLAHAGVLHQTREHAQKSSQAQVRTLAPRRAHFVKPNAHLLDLCIARSSRFAE